MSQPMVPVAADVNAVAGQKFLDGRERGADGRAVSVRRGFGEPLQASFNEPIRVPSDDTEISVSMDTSAAQRVRDVVWKQQN